MSLLPQEYPAQPELLLADAEPLQVESNFCRLEPIGAKHIYVYVVEIHNTEADDDAQKEQVGEAAVRSSVFTTAQTDGLTSKYVFFDGHDYAYSAKALHKKWGPDDSKTVRVQPPDHPMGFRLGIRLQRRYDTAALERYCRGDKAVEGPYVQALLYVLDNILRAAMKQAMENIGGRFLTSHQKIETQAGFDVWWEYRLTLRPSRQTLLLNLAPRAVPVINVRTVADLARIFFSRRSDPPKTDDWARFEPYVRNLRVTESDGSQSVRLLGLSRASPNTASSADLQWPQAKTDAGTEVPLDQCVLDSKHVLGGISGWQRRQLMELSVLPPAKRRDLLIHGAELLGRVSKECPDLRVFGISVVPQLVQAAAQVIKPPRLSADNKKLKVKAGSWEVAKVAQGICLRSWAVLVVGSSKSALPEAQVQAFIAQLIKVATEMGIRIEFTQPPVSYALARASIQDDLQGICAAAQRVSGKPAELILCILPSYSVPLYGEIKRVALTQIGVQTQCVQVGNVRGHRAKLLPPILLKINTKLGGLTCHVRLPLIEAEPTMVISADVCHTTEAGAMSVASIVWSVDLQAQRFAGVAVQHPQRMEIIENFDVIVRHCLRVFFQRTGKKPARIVYYRDGANDSQLPWIKQIELAAIVRGCQLVEATYAPKVTVVIARKRHHSRFLLADGRNCPPGTIVHMAASPTIFSFYLVSHTALCGTAKPVYFMVLHDDSEFAPEALVRLTYHLGYAYPIISRSATMPASLYYAHRLSNKGRLQIDQPFDTLPHFAGSSSSRSGRSKKTKPVKPHLVPVHQDIENTMYFM
ncbi:hypothetical protein GGF46_004729 [Coemansia sp. RSA 552]|nr:hypothetical protein GGF46_004729 [Coemansia sp. RSA 552]